MGGLHQPHDLLLHLGQAPEAGLDREIATGDRHRRRLPAGGADDDRRQVAQGLRGLDPGDNGELAAVLPLPFGECFLQPLDVAGTLHEAVTDETAWWATTERSLAARAGTASAVSGKFRPLRA
jgi:hypothetical protein